MDTLRTTFQDVGVIKQFAKRGDVLEFDRDFFSHYALYIGKDDKTGEHMVINVSAENMSMTKADIELLPLDSVAKSSKIKISNHDETAKRYYKRSPRTPDEIVNAARQYLGSDWDYSFMGTNCEYYCMLWRFGVGFSTQVCNGLSLKHGSKGTQGPRINVLGTGRTILEAFPLPSPSDSLVNFAVEAVVKVGAVASTYAAEEVLKHNQYSGYREISKNDRRKEAESRKQNKEQ